MITLSSEYVVLQVYTPHDRECGPYVQILQEEDGALHLEAASNQFLDPQIGPDAINTLREMGWDDPEGVDGIPNFKIFLRPDEVSPGEVARFLVATLRDAYLVTPNDSFEFAPPELFVAVPANPTISVEVFCQVAVLVPCTRIVPTDPELINAV
jgi:hypothetical protein